MWAQRTRYAHKRAARKALQGGGYDNPTHYLPPLSDLRRGALKQARCVVVSAGVSSPACVRTGI